MGTQATWRGGARYKIEDEKDAHTTLRRATCYHATRTPHYDVRRATMRREHHTATATLRRATCEDVRRATMRRATRKEMCEVRGAKRDVGTCNGAAALSGVGGARCLRTI